VSERERENLSKEECEGGEGGKEIDATRGRERERGNE
tara:strand:+ start:718 stop:828 length:111 start_codon:yes stop_codon:yes gene_type:complete